MSNNGDRATDATPPCEARVGTEHDGLRLDRALAQLIPELSRSRLQALLKAGAVSLDGRPVGDAKRRVTAGESYLVTVPEPEPAAPEPQAIALTVVYEDDDLIVIDKPAGLVVHPAAGHASGTLVNALLAHCGDSLSGIGGVKRPGIVHRLDKDTTGLLVVAKSDAAHRGLSEQFRLHGADGRLERRYRALVWGVPLRQKGTIDAPLGRSRGNRTRIGVVHGESGRRAVTHYAVLETFKDAAGEPVASLLEFTLETGRTHQIRVHAAHIGHPVLGDQVYGTGFQTRAARLPPEARAALVGLDRQALHAAKLTIEHPETGERLDFDSALPGDMARLLAALQGEQPTVAKVRATAKGRTGQRRSSKASVAKRMPG